MNRTETETLQLASTTSWKLYYARDSLILVWKFSNSYYPVVIIQFG